MGYPTNTRKLQNISNHVKGEYRQNIQYSIVDLENVWRHYATKGDKDSQHCKSDEAWQQMAWHWSVKAGQLIVSTGIGLIWGYNKR